MITLQQLITVAPFPEETKNELLGTSETLSDAKKFELEKLCWQLISTSYHTDVRLKQEIAAVEMAKGEKMYAPEELNKIADDLFTELLGKFEVQKNTEDIENVRDKLSEYFPTANKN